MIDRIEISFNNAVNLEQSVLIIVNKKKCYINKNVYSISDETISKILDILATWQYEYGSSNIIDAEEFNIKVYDSKSVTSYHGRGIFPPNYSEFKGVIDGIEVN